MRRALAIVLLSSLVAYEDAAAAPSLPKLPSAAEAEAQAKAARDAAAKKAAEVEAAAREAAEKAGVDPKKVVEEAQKQADKLVADKALQKVKDAIGAKLALPTTPERASFTATFTLPSEDEIAQAYERLEKKAPKSTRAELKKLRAALAKTNPDLRVGMTSLRLDPRLRVTGTLRPPTSKKAREKIAKLTADSRARIRKARSEENEKAAAAPAPAPPPSVKKKKKGKSLASEALPMTNPSSTCKAGAKRWSWLASMNPIDHQGTCGTCWAFATASAFEASHRIFNDATYDFSEQWIHDCHRGPGAPCNEGGWYPIEAMRSMMKTGIGFTADAPYTQQNNKCGVHPHSYYQAAAAGTVVDSWWDMPTPAELKEALCEHGPIVVEVFVGDLFQWDNQFTSYIGGVFDAKYTTNPHAMTLIGWDDAKQAWLVRNSWGTGWGIHGHMWIEYGASDVGRNAAWVAAAPGELGGDPAGGWFVQREIRVNNQTGGDIKVRISYDAWVGQDGWRRFPEADYGRSNYEYTVGPTGKKGTPLADARGKLVRAGRVKISAEGSNGKKWSPRTHKFEEAYRAKSAKPFVITFGD